MDTTAQSLELYRELETVHQAMLDSARGDDWEEVARIGQRAEAITTQLAGLERSHPLDVETRKALAPLMQRTLDLVSELRKLAEPARADRAAQLASNAQRNKLNDSYGV